MNDWKNYAAPADVFRDRVILVTGAAQGLGETAAKALAQQGATVILLDRNEKKLGKVYDGIEAAGGPLPAEAPLDFSTAGEVEIGRLAVLIDNEFGRLDGILHAANGFTHLSPLANQTLDEWTEMFRVNVAVPFALTRALFPLLAQSPDAAVLVLGETHALAPKAFWGGYSVSKIGQKNWVEIAADEWDNLPNLRINLLIPGPIQSPFRLATHPAESKDGLPSAERLVPAFLHWLGPESRGRSGEVLYFSDIVMN
ncbi:MAG: SDR family NAD(P)-dependent oxidoreductase [Formivibrio sp.]|nr:SDR family NAD(P)-dependent oxidoreductase [Formivibrio sp.]